ncbi:adenylate/guanylate cyclase domain-containing protein [Hyphococcus flavus]|uniref:Adenylate/guanylate cyclase domain-containing protein n=1 Tax=Hyphococcus flavus TaxID=1866326 RepID=A0AAE9ZAK3_9PROT|nr:adenylate/guanylate cyclase domain-containing protein [Hyphococcus flavus]WDI30166.1 adenylate/guanylate cyclase domain-containing protein [Hyphococcus flavus]
MAFDSKYARLLRLPVIAAMAAGLAAAASAPFSDYLTRLGIDLTLPLAGAFAGEQKEEADIALVLIDETTHNSPPFSEIPDVAWTPHLADVFQAVDGGGPKVMGLDMIFQKTLSTRDLIPGFDRPFLRAIASSARPGRLVLAEVRLSENAITPYQGQILAAGIDNIRSVQIIPDADNVIRRHPPQFDRVDGTVTPSFAAELARRAGAEAAPEGEPFLIDFLTTVETIPAYRVADLYACAQAGRTDVFEAFKDKIVLIGTSLDVEDRHVAANRFVENRQPVIRSLDCGVASTSPKAPPRGTVPGVLIEALAANTLLHDSDPQMMPRRTSFAVSAAIFVLLGVIFFRIQPVIGVVVIFGAAALMWAAGAFMLSAGTVTPVIAWMGGGGIMYTVVYSYRTFLEDQEKRWIRHAFQHYLSPALVDQLAENPDSLRLGGERRRAAILFVDMAGFSKLTGELADRPQVLAAKLNDFLSAVADAIDNHEGYVDKFIGDAVMGVWGAPIEIDRMEVSAAKATLECKKAVEKLSRESKREFGLRAGLSTGDVIAGNLGSRNRFNYSVVGDSVNIAARLEPASKDYGTSILADDDFAAALGDEFILRPVDIVILRGRSEYSVLHEILGLRAEMTPADMDHAAEFARAVELFRNRQFSNAAQMFAKWKNDDQLSAMYHRRATDFASSQPPQNWNGSLTAS